MQIKLKQIIDSETGLGIITNLEFKATELFKVTKFIEACDHEIKAFNSVREEKIKQFGEQREVQGKQVFEVSKDNQEQFFTEMEELLNQDIELEVPEISLDAFGDIEMSPKEFLSLQWLIKKED